MLAIEIKSSRITKHQHKHIKLGTWKTILLWIISQWSLIKTNDFMCSRLEFIIIIGDKCHILEAWAIHTQIKIIQIYSKLSKYCLECILCKLTYTIKLESDVAFIIKGVNKKFCRMRSNKKPVGV